MTSQAKVQGYLQKHKIGNLFEGMMAKLVKDLPIDPYEYLVQLIHDKKQKVHKHIGPHEEADTRSVPTSVWASTDAGYDKPWKANSKQTAGRLSKSQDVSRRDWDKTVKLTSKTFDDLAVTSDPKTRKAGAVTFKSKTDSVFEVGSRPDEDCFVSEEDFLAGEAIHSSRKAKRAIADATESNSAAKHHPKLKGPKADSARHTQELREFIESKRQEKKLASSADSGLGVSVSDEEESGYVMAENSADLESEGIKVSGSKNRKNVNRPITEPVVTVSICSRCAKVMTGDKLDTASNVSKGSASTVSTRASKQKLSRDSARSADLFATHRTDPKSPPLKNPAVHKEQSKGDAASRKIDPATARLDYTAANTERTARSGFPTQRTGFSSHYDDVDDEFESVSQISGDGQRIPTWTNSDDEDLSPVKGAHMLTSPRQSLTKQPSASRKTVTLKEDLLRSLPQSTSTVEDFLAVAVDNKTWSGEKTTRRSHDSFGAAPQRSANQRATHKSYDASQDKNVRGAGGWRFDMNSEDESTVVP